MSWTRSFLSSPHWFVVRQRQTTNWLQQRSRSRAAHKPPARRPLGKAPTTKAPHRNTRRKTGYNHSPLQEQDSSSLTTPHSLSPRKVRILNFYSQLWQIIAFCCNILHYQIWVYFSYACDVLHQSYLTSVLYYVTATRQFPTLLCSLVWSLHWLLWRFQWRRNCVVALTELFGNRTGQCVWVRQTPFKSYHCCCLVENVTEVWPVKI